MIVELDCLDVDMLTSRMAYMDTFWGYIVPREDLASTSTWKNVAQRASSPSLEECVAAGEAGTTLDTIIATKLRTSGPITAATSHCDAMWSLDCSFLEYYEL